jgi:hypothetical protein
MPGASQQTRRVKNLNANWVPATAGRDEQFEIAIITDDDQQHSTRVSPAAMTALATLAQTGTVMAWDPEDSTLIIANIVGQIPWTVS